MGLVVGLFDTGAPVVALTVGDFVVGLAVTGLADGEREVGGVGDEAHAEVQVESELHQAVPIPQ